MSQADSHRAVASEPTGWAAKRWTPRTAMEAPSALPVGAAVGWKPLLRHQRKGEPLRGDFHPGWARLGWNVSVLVAEFAFAGNGAGNRARGLNERAHLLGDVGEIFLQWAGADRYIEIQVTPENQRLQLGWSGERIAAVRKGQATLEDFTISDPDWVQSVTTVAPTFWSARVVVPAAAILAGGREFDPETALLAAVGRYDYGGRETPILSASTDFRGQPFHTRAAWHRVRLEP